MTDTTIVALVSAVIAGIPATLVAWAALKKIEANTVATLATEKKTDEIIVKAEEIHELANSNLSKMANALEIANTKVEGLQKLVSELAIKVPEQKAAIAEQKTVVAEQKTVIAEQKAVLADQKLIVEKQNGHIGSVG